jgi:hypothetical protein
VESEAEVLTAISMMSSIFWDATLYCPVEFNDVSEEPTASIKEYVSLLFDPEDGSNIFIRNVGELYRTTQIYIPKDSTLKSDKRSCRVN